MLQKNSKPFFISLWKNIRRLTLHQIFNCDETGLYWRLLPNKTLADASEKCAKNFKSSKDRVTLMATANASGDFKLPLVFIHKSCRPHCFSGVNMSALPVHYYSQKKWMDGRSDFILIGFTSTLFPQLSNTCSQSHYVLRHSSSITSSSTLVSDGKIKCLFFSPNVSSLVQNGSVSA